MADVDEKVGAALHKVSMPASETGVCRSQSVHVPTTSPYFYLYMQLSGAQRGCHGWCSPGHYVEPKAANDESK